MLLLCSRILIRLDFLNQFPMYSKTQARFSSFGKRLLANLLHSVGEER